MRGPRVQPLRASKASATIPTRVSRVFRSTQQIVPLAVIKARRRRRKIAQFIVAITTGQNGHERYSIAKFLAFERFMESASLLRAFAILFVTPLPGLLATLIPSLIPLQNPMRGASANPGFFIQLGVIVFLVAVGVIMHIQAGANIPRQYYSNIETLVVSMLCACIHVGIIFGIASRWRFPIPFLWGFGTPIFTMNLCIAHFVVLRKRLFGPAGLIAATMVYSPAVVIQFSQVLIYPAFSAIFERSSSAQQIVMTILFPFVKYAMRKLLRKYTKRLGDRGGEVAVSGVEICGTLYQSMILQSVPSGIATIIIMSIDIIQGMLTIHMFMEKKSVVRQNQIITTAFRALRKSQTRETMISSTISSTTSSDSGFRIVQLPVPVTPTALTSVSPSVLSVANIPDKEFTPFDDWKSEEQHQVIRHALELVSTAETILLMEYFEVTIPVISAVFLSIASRFPSAQYDPKLEVYVDDPSRLLPVLKAIGIYSCLQMLSLVSMHFVMKSRYGLSALYHLVFTLEYHAQSIQGKMLGWLIVILHFNGRHFGKLTSSMLLDIGVYRSWNRIDTYALVCIGTDLAFKFDFQSHANSTTIGA